jgi:hypothetical protein
MRVAVVLLILVGHVLAMAVGRCQTVWHDTTAQGVAHSGHCEPAGDRSHPDHPVMLIGFGADHDHPESTPDHSHLPIPQGFAKLLRVQLVVPELVAPVAYVELDRLLQPALKLTSQPCADRSDDRASHAIPLSGSTTHLLF